MIPTKQVPTCRMVRGFSALPIMIEERQAREASMARTLWSAEGTAQHESGQAFSKRWGAAQRWNA